MNLLDDNVFGFDVIRSKQFETKGDLLEYHKQKVKELECDGDSPEVPLNQLSNIQILFDQMNESRQLELDMNSLIEEHNINCGFEYTIDDSLNDNSFPVKVNFLNNKFIVIETPTMFKNAERYSNSKQLCMLAREVDCARKLYEKRTHTSLAMTIKAPYWMIMIRKIRSGKAGNVADTDNIEAKKISNIISKFLFLSDAPTVKRDLTLCEEVSSKDELGTMFIVAEEKDVLPLLRHYVEQKSISDFIFNL